VIVVDASAVIARLLRTARADAVDSNEDLHAPELCDLEVASALRNGVQRRELKLERAVEAVSDYAAWSLVLHGHRPLLIRCLALFDNFSPYDASYVALAERLNAPLLTLDARFARAVARHTSVELVAP
jgi:predicted nucleic acid-binding protein